MTMMCLWSLLVLSSVICNGFALDCSNYQDVASYMATLPMNITELVCNEFNPYPKIIPDNIGDYSSLTKLDFYYIGASIPEGIGKLSQLEHLLLDTWFPPTSKFPSAFLKLNKLETMALTGIYDIHDKLPNLNVFTNLRSLSITDSNLHFTFPNAFTGLTSLTHLNLANALSAVPSKASLKPLSNLDTLNLEGTYFGGTMPTTFGTLTKLTSLNLNYVAFESDQNFEQLKKLSKLEYLNNRYMTFDNPKRLEIGFFPKLKELETTWVAPDIDKATDLIAIDCRSCFPQGVADLKAITRLKNLVRLQIGFVDEFGMDFPAEEFAKMSSLGELEIKYSKLDGHLMRNFSGMVKLSKLSIYETRLSGTISTDIGLMTNLLSLRLHSNFLTGTVPSEIGLLPNLNTISLDNNRFTGTAPEWPDSVFSYDVQPGEEFNFNDESFVPTKSPTRYRDNSPTTKDSKPNLGYIILASFAGLVGLFFLGSIMAGSKSMLTAATAPSNPSTGNNNITLARVSPNQSGLTGGVVVAEVAADPTGQILDATIASANPGSEANIPFGETLREPSEVENFDMIPFNPMDREVVVETPQRVETSL